MHIYSQKSTWSLVRFLRRKWLSLAPLAGLLLLLSGCTLPFTPSAAPLSGQITVDGSTALQPLVSKAATLFTQIHPQVHIKVNGGGSLSGLNDVTGHKVDIGNSDIYADPATYPDPDLTDHLVCVVPFTMIVSSDVPVTSLTTADIINIFANGTITNWNQVGGPDLPIVPLVRSPSSGTRATFRRYVLGGRDELGDLTAVSSSQDLVNSVASTPGSIGYLAETVLDSHVHAIGIDGNAATIENIDAGKYTFWSYEHMYTLAVTNGSPVDAFLNFMLTPQVQQEATSLHYFSISALKFAQTSLPVPGTTAFISSYLWEEKGVFYG